MYIEIKTRVESDQYIHCKWPNTMTQYEGIKPREKERMTNVKDFVLELEQRCDIRYGINPDSEKS